MNTNFDNLPKGWLAFELNVLRRLKFGSIALPFAGDAALGVYLKRQGARVLANDILQSAFVRATARIQNNGEYLSEERVDQILQDVYVPRHRLYNPSLRNWFNETDAWWFDNVRENIGRIESPFARAIALELGIAVGDYVLSFDQETLELRQPLSVVYRRLWNSLPLPVNNGKNNLCSNKEAREFVHESACDVLFLRMPHAHDQNLKAALGWTAWREDWVRGSGSFWDQLELQQAGRLGAKTNTKHQYLRHLEDMLHTASATAKWVIAAAETDFIATADLTETINRVRRVETVYTKDFSELTNSKAVIFVA